jgi:methyl-accepting chemotaxis protein
VTQQLGDNASQFAATAQGMEQRVQDVATATTQLSQSIGSAASELKAAAEETRAAASGLQTSAAQTQDAAKQTIDAVSSSQQLTAQVAEASRKWGDAQNSLKDLADKSKDGLNDIVRALKAAAERLASEQLVVVKRPRFWPFTKKSETA